MSKENVSVETASTALVLANAAELTAAIIQRVAGNDLSTAINGQSLTRESIQDLAMAKLRDKIVKRVNG